MRALSCLDRAVDPERLVRTAHAAGLDAVVLNDDLVELEDVVALVRASGLRVVLNLPLLFDVDLLTRLPDSLAVTSAGRPAVAEWLRMACPRDDEFWQARLDKIRPAVESVRPDLALLDFARTFVLWEQVGPDAEPRAIEHGCWCARCRAAGDDATTVPADAVTARVIQASAVVRRSAPGTPVGVKLVPWLATDYGGAREWACGQDLRALAPWVDVVVPMSFSSLIGRPTTYLATLHREIRETTGRALMPWLQAADPASPTALGVEQVSEMLDAVERDADLGYGVFHLDGVADRPDILALLASRAPQHRSPKETS